MTEMNQRDGYESVIVVPMGPVDPWDQRFLDASGDHVLDEFHPWRSVLPVERRSVR